MTDETDFLELYGKLRLRPDCSLDEFRLAYRRYVGQWHPDRRRGPRAQKLAASRLQRIIAQYDAAMAFHRRHGRLPGAGFGAAPVRTPMAVSASVEPVKAPVAERRQRMPRLFVPLAVVALIALAYPLLSPGTKPSVDTVADTGDVNAPVNDAPVEGRLSLGMSMDEVRGVEGEPTRRGEERWEYGASWVGFEKGTVTDWYSSPWQPLHVASAHAPR
ncbi:J domain-containing protein [Luteibacter sp. CQ10]|uniref:J domain-containing protein n=1 Tax=Luteibacter sp. CQ10 TaxID=2805821 RepID=UPI0034A3438E